jgi:hypothetical protein
MPVQPPSPPAALASARNGRRVMKLTRVRVDTTDNTSRTLHFTYPGVSGYGNSRVGFIASEHVPQFDGEEGRFELERVKAVPWSYWRAIRRLDPPPHA